jgi:hypothetical protein
LKDGDLAFANPGQMCPSPNGWDDFSRGAR